MKSFSSLALREALLNNLITLQYEHMTPVQEQSLPPMLEKHDVVAQAKTGSGKTVAFGLALLQHLNVDEYVVQALVLCPTRELADQVSQAIRQLARQIPNIKVLNLSGGMPMKVQVDSLKHAAHIIVGTPGRIQKHLDKQTLSLRRVQTLVLDEADRMLDMGFVDAIEAIMKHCPPQRQTLLFSATYPAEIKKLTNRFLKKPMHITIEDEATDADIQQLFYQLDNHKSKIQLLKTLLWHHKPASALIFCNTKELTTQLSTMLNADGIISVALNGDMEQVDRDAAMIRFKNNSCSVLVATDVAARGLDVKDLPLVINFELAFEHDVHTHRIGRTGRAGSKGIAISLALPIDAERIALIEEDLGQRITWSNSAQLNVADKTFPLPEMVTLSISAGKKDKIRPGDILGSLTKDAGLPGDTIGKIDIFSIYSYVAVKRKQVGLALDHFQNGKLKGRKLSARQLK